MTIEAAEDALNGAFNTALGGTIPIAWSNREFDTVRDAAAAEWAYFAVNWNGGTAGEVSGKMFRRFGILTAQIFVPANAGKRRALQLAESVLATFEGQTIGGVRVRNVGPLDVGVTERWYQMNVTGELTYDQFR